MGDYLAFNSKRPRRKKKKDLDDESVSRTCMPFSLVTKHASKSSTSKYNNGTSPASIPLTEQSDEWEDYSDMQASGDPLLPFETWKPAQGEVTPSASSETFETKFGDFKPLAAGSNRSRQRRSTYEGEAEPEGTRGQEATASTFVPSTPPVKSNTFQKFVVSPLSDDGSASRDSFGFPSQESATNETNQNILPQSYVNRNFRDNDSGYSGESSSSSSFSEEEPSDYEPAATPLADKVFRNDRDLFEPSPDEKNVFSPAYQPLEDEAEDDEDDFNNSNSWVLSSTQPQLTTPASKDLSSEPLNRSSPPSTALVSPLEKRQARFRQHRREEQGGRVEQLNAKAIRHVELGEYNHALQLFQMVLELLQQEENSDSAALVASTRHNIGLVHSKRAAFFDGPAQTEAIQLSLANFQAAARGARDALGPNHYQIASSLVRIGFLLLDCHEYSKAVVTFTEALRIRLHHFGPLHLLVANIYNDLGVTYMHLHEWKPAQDNTTKALSIQRSLVDELNNSEEEEEMQEALAKMYLELADTLCNVGGLHLERLQYQPEEKLATRTDWARHAVSSFTEAKDLRYSVLDQDDSHPLIIQARSLQDLAQASLQQLQTKRNTKNTIAHVVSQDEQDQDDELDPFFIRRTASGEPLPLQEVVTTDVMDDSLHGNDSFSERSRRLPDGSTRIWVSPHEIPTKSPPRESSVFSTPKRERTYSYDAEESCLIGNTNPTELDFLDSDHREIMVVQPSNTPKAIQPLVSRKTISWSQAIGGGGDESSLERQYYDSPSLTAQEQEDVYEIDSPQLVPRTAPTVTREMMEEPELHLKQIHYVASEYLKDNRLHEAILLFETVLTCQRQIHGELHEEVGAAHHNVGLVHLRAERHDEALASFELAVRVRKGALGRDHPDVAVSLVKVGIAQLLLHRFENSIMAFRDALSIRKHSLGALHPSLARIYSNIGCVHLEFNEVSEARRAFEGALDIQRNALCEEPDSGPLMFGTATTLCNLGYLYKSRNMHGKAAVIFKEAVNLQEVVLGKTHPTVLSTLDSLAEANTKCSNCATALKCYYDILDRLPPPSVGNEGKRIRRKRAEALILYKMSRVHGKQNDLESQLDKLKGALGIVRELSSLHSNPELTERLQRGIQNDINGVQEEMARRELEWV